MDYREILPPGNRITRKRY